MDTSIIEPSIKIAFTIFFATFNSPPFFSFLSKIITYLVLIVGFSIQGKAQNENAQWRFGRNAGLDFMVAPPGNVTWPLIFSNESAASVADGAGNLLFYTDGIDIWNQNNVVMANGGGLSGNPSSTQGALIVKKPGSATEYYVFTTGQNGPLCYTILDMSLAAGLGSVTAMNMTLTNNSSEKLTATKHCNGVDYWIMGHEKTTNNFLCYLLTNGGLSAPVVSPIGLSYVNSQAGQGQMKFSPAGNKLAAATYDLGRLEVFDFNKSTGVVSNLMSLVGLPYCYGTDFSPDGTKLYTCLASFNADIYQYNLCAGSTTAAIANSQYVVSNTGVLKASMMLAPNGQIYAARPAETTIASITNPNALGAACGYVELAQSVFTGTSTAALPNNIKEYTPALPLPVFSSTVSNIPACHGAVFSPTIASYFSNCASIPNYSLSSLQWNFGDPASGASNISTALTPTHSYSGLGTYTVQLTVFYTCGGGSVTVSQQVTISQPCFSVTGNNLTCANLGSSTITALGGTGPFNYTWTPGGQNGPVANNLIPGNYVVSAFDTGMNTLLTYSISLSSQMAYNGSITTSSITCSGAATGSASLTSLTGGSGAQTYNWTNGLVTYTTAAPASLSVGSWSLIVTDALTGCIFDTSFVLVQAPPLNLSLSPANGSVCATETLALVSTILGGTPAYSYTWAGGPANTNYTITPPSGGIYVYSVTVTDANLCTVSGTVSVNTVPLPPLSVTSATICQLETATLTASGSAVYLWNGVTGAPTFTDNPNSNTQYTITGTTAGCSSSVVAQITTKPLPVFSIASNNPLCSGYTFSASVNTGTAFIWQGPQSFSAVSPNILITPVSFNVAGIYGVTVTAANSCSAAATTSLTVYDLPVLSALGSTVCTGQTLNLSASSTATNFLWSGPQSFTSNVQNPAIANTTAPMSGIYTVTVTSADNCSSTAQAQVSVVPPPTLSVALSSGSMCAQALNGSQNTITLTSSGAVTYTLSTPNHIYNPNPSGPASPVSLAPPYLPTGPATATLYGSNGVCTVSVSANFNVVPNPVLTTLNPTPYICSGQSHTYTSSGATSYMWSATSPGITTYTTGDVIVSSPTVNSVFAVVGGSLGCYSAVQTSTLTVFPLPTLTLNPKPAVACVNGNSVLKATGTGTLYSWSPPLWLNTTTGPTVLCTPLANQTYTVVSSLRSCTNSAVISVSLQTLPTAVISTTGTSMCANGSLTLSGSGADFYLWNGPSGYQAQTQEALLNGFSGAHTGIFTLTVSDQYGCKGSATQAITVHALPTGSFNDNLSGCVPLDVLPAFTVNPGSAQLASTTWLYSGQTYTTTLPTIHLTKAGSYPLYATINDVNGCIRTFSALITAHPKPEADFTFSANEAIEGFDEISFSNGSSLATDFTWYFGDHRHSSFLKDPVFLFEDAGIYPVVLVAKNQWHCTDTIIKPVKILADAGVYIPTAFTPNEDGRNDLFGPVARRPLDLKITIIDRWGAVLYEGSNAGAVWDGSYRGQPCKEDTYIWMLEITDRENSKENRKLTGHVTLYR